ncbi:hypothetical protein B9T62_08070 [Paenibacillus donghaensis]|uniref:Uncharacterized protein n=1 Tax=Paenibacillus donghaensis TaxID=414771 RepID=A0A2Z2KAU9_9BACL|nr:hypothetical protein B9T62_08070 [Paenibacillus donghaensis]
METDIKEDTLKQEQSNQSTDGSNKSIKKFRIGKKTGITLSTIAFLIGVLTLRVSIGQVVEITCLMITSTNSKRNLRK